MKTAFDKIVEDYVEACSVSQHFPYGMWMTALFDWCRYCQNGEERPFQPQTEIFFELIERLLEAEKIVLSLPVALLLELSNENAYVGFSFSDQPNLPVEWKRLLFFDKNPTESVEQWKAMEMSGEAENLDNYFGVWQAPISEKLDYMRANWPDSVSNADDPLLDDFFYGAYCPIIGWIETSTGYVRASL